jgi:hypothetical protein
LSVNGTTTVFVGVSSINFANCAVTPPPSPETAQSPLEFRGTTGYSDLMSAVTEKIDDIEAQMSRQCGKVAEMILHQRHHRFRAGKGLWKTPDAREVGTAISDSHMGFASTQAFDLMKGLKCLTQMGVHWPISCKQVAACNALLG